ncbi:MAG: hypothetical protein VX527_04215 [Planctomycetota bacterium]|nr:hypothetical protein [Planctomycetota bacterium]
MSTVPTIIGSLVLTASSMAFAQTRGVIPDDPCSWWGEFDCDCDEVPDQWICLDNYTCGGGGCATGVGFRQPACTNTKTNGWFHSGTCPDFAFYGVPEEVIEVRGATGEPPAGEYHHWFIFYELEYQQDGPVINCSQGDLIGSVPNGVEGSQGEMLQGRVEWTRTGPNDLEIIIHEPMGLRVLAVVSGHACWPTECLGYPCCPAPADLVIQSPTSDFDEDGLDYQFECEVCPGEYDPWEFDTDGNGCSDGGEDCDGDGLSNLDELFYGTNPSNTDSDGDGVSDQQEIDQVSDPNDPDDYEPAPECSICDLTLIVGDPSGSHSELYELSVDAFTHNSSGAVGGFGEVVARTVQVERSKDAGVVLTGMIQHMGSTIVFGDLDAYVGISSNCPLCLTHDDFGFRPVPPNNNQTWYYDPELWQYFFSYDQGSGPADENQWWACPDGSPRRVDIELLKICRGDIDGDNMVDGSDIGLLLVAWGTNDWCADLNDDGIVNGEDLGVMLAGFANCTPACSDHAPSDCQPHRHDSTWEVAGHKAVISRCDVGGSCHNSSLEECDAVDGTWYLGDLCPEAGCQSDP